MAELLSEDAKTAISAAIEQAESSTSGEIVFALTDASARYRHATLQGALTGMVLATALYLTPVFFHSISLLLWIQLVSFAAFYALFSIIPWRRWFISMNEMDARVRDAAFLEFYSSGLYRTREANGILIYLSCFEHIVVVLGDRGINEKLGNNYWNDVRDRIIQGIHQGKAREGICEAIEICGRELARHFPPRHDDVNELANRVIHRKTRPDAP